MTRKSRPRVKEHIKKELKGGYCEICNADYVDAIEHQRSPHHLAFVRNHNNFLALDELIAEGADVTSFLEKATPLNGERRSLRKMCNGELDSSQTRSRRSLRSKSPDSPVNGNQSPKHANGNIEDEKKHNTRCSNKKSDHRNSEDQQYYKVVGVSTKLRSSGGFASKRKEMSAPTCNGGTKPLVVKFRKIRRSELSVLSDEAEQFMFPKRASSTSSTSSDEVIQLKNHSQPVGNQESPVSLSRRRLARPLALKEESSEEDSWPETKRKKKRRVSTIVRKTRPTRSVPIVKDFSADIETPVFESPTPLEETQFPDDATPLKEESEKCLKWEDGKLKYTPSVEQLEFAFESVPNSEPWFETFKRQDDDKVIMKNVTNYFGKYFFFY